METKQGLRMNELARNSNVLDYPATVLPERDNGEMSRTGRLLCYIGAAMADPRNPKIWSWNPSVITLLIVIISLIAGAAYYMGGRDAEIKMMKEQVQKALSDSDKAKQLESYKAGSVDAMKGHGEANTSTEKK